MKLSLNPSSSQFKAKVEQLRTAVRTHINQEENDILPKLRDNFSHEQQKQMATDFKQLKQTARANGCFNHIALSGVKAKVDS